MLTTIRSLGSQTSVSAAEAKRGVTLFDLSAHPVLRHHPARARAPGGAFPRRGARRQVETIGAFAGIAACRREAATLAARIEAAPRLSGNVVVALPVGRAVARENRSEPRRREARRKRVGRTEARVVRLQLLRIIRSFGGEQMLPRELIGVYEAGTVAMLDDLVIGRIGTEDQLRAVGPVDEPARVLAVDECSEIRVGIEVFLVLKLFDRITVVVPVASAHPHGRSRRTAPRAARKVANAHGARIWRLHQRSAVVERVEVRHRVADPGALADQRRVTDIVGGAGELRRDSTGHVEHLDIVTQRRVAMRDPDVEVDDVLPVGIVGLRVAVAGLGDEPVVGIPAGRAVEDVVDVIPARDVERIEVQWVADAAELVGVAERLIRSREPHVVREQAIGRRTAGFDRRLMVECRSADAQVRRRVAREGSRLDDLIDVARQARGVRSRGRAARIDLHFLVAQRRQRCDRREIRLPGGRQPVELIGDLVNVAAADVNALIPALLVGRDVDAGSARDRAVRLR